MVSWVKDGEDFGEDGNKGNNGAWWHQADDDGIEILDVRDEDVLHIKNSLGENKDTKGKQENKFRNFEKLWFGGR